MTYQGALTIEVIRRWDDAELISLDWDRLLSRCSNATVFQTFEWHAAWWAAFGHRYELLLLVAREGGRLVGLAPLMIALRGKMFPRISFIGRDGSDYQDFLIASGAEELAVNRFMEWLLKSTRSWTVLEFRNLPEESRNLPQLLRYGDAVSLNRIMLRVRCPTLFVKGYENSIRNLLRKYSMRRPLNRLQKQGRISFLTFDSVAEQLNALPLLASQHVRRRQQARMSSPLREPETLVFFEQLIRRLGPRGWIHFSSLELNAEPIALHFGFLFRDRLIWYKPSFDVGYAKFSPGTVTLRFLIEYACAAQLRELDFTIGDESFKSRYANNVRHNVTILLFRSRLQYFFVKYYRNVRRMMRSFVERHFTAASRGT